jgi:hypothetical protein
MRAVRRRAHGHRALHVGMWNAIVVEIEARVGRLANVHGNDVISVERVVGQREKLQLLVLKGLSNAELAIGRANAVASLVVAPQRCLRVEIGKIGECACGKEAVTHVANGTLDAALLIAARRCDGARFVAVMSGELQQGRIKLNGVALSPQDGAFEILCVVTGYVQLWHLVVVRDCPCRSEREVIASGLLGPRVQIPAGRRDRGLPQSVAHRRLARSAAGVGRGCHASGRRKCGETWTSLMPANRAARWTPFHAVINPRQPEPALPCLYLQQAIGTAGVRM